jgi:hypothetical protein
MSWMRYGEYSAMKAMHDSSCHATVTSKADPSAGKKTLVSEKTSHRDLNDSEKSYKVDGQTSWPKVPPFEIDPKHQYPRRTLDQFYYPALCDTSARDKDQTISKWTGTSFKQDSRNEAVADSAMIMVDQFWCWIIDESLSSVLLGLLLIADQQFRDHHNEFP